MNLLDQPCRVGQLVHMAERAIDPATVAFYADTFHDRHPAYAAAEPVAPPLLFHSEVYQHAERWYLKRLVGNLHTRQEWLLFAPLRPGTSVHTRSMVVERYCKRGRDYVVNEVDYCDGEGRLLLRGRTHQSFLADEPARDAGYVVDKGSEKLEPRAARPEPAGPEIEPVELDVDLETCWRFSGPGRSYHTDPEQARKLGFPDVVVQGMLSTCLVSQQLANAYGDGWFSGGRMDVKLVNVVWGGERLRARARVREDLPEGGATRRVLDVRVEKDDAKGTLVTVGSASALI